MLKALLMASVIIGAFLFQPSVFSNTDPDRFFSCEPDEVVLLGIGCGKSAPSRSCELTSIRTDHPLGIVNISSIADLDALVASNNRTYSPPNCIHESPGGTSQPFAVSDTWSHQFVKTCPESSETTVTVTQPTTVTKTTLRKTTTRLSGDACRLNDHDTQTTNYTSALVVTYTLSDEIQCPASHPLGPIYYDRPPILGHFCYRVPTDEPDDECPPDTIGGCGEQPDPGSCFMAGNGMEVCPSDPDEKCTSYVHEGQTFYDCPANCGFIQDMFYCTKEPDIPDIPDMSHCFKVATGYACPSDSPNPDDTLDNPNKPMPDMTKGDFKETNKGIETRLNATNKLLGDLTGYGAANNQALADLNAKQLAANGILNQIRQNTAATAGNTKDIKDALTGDALELEPDTAESILSGLGLTGDETFSDLEKEVVSLDSYRSQFNWSAGSSSCPPDRSMSLLGKSFLIDWQPYCDAFGVLGYFVKAAALLISGFIAFGVRK